ncbi:DAK2 domain-containing protein [Micrococcoides hystricis]|uniref:DAK2 domain-containing protein n=1 Tax=Micrococcoides hystricis TaxID=1572761 RepID=A0ABV6PC37_9MICC
MVAPSAPGKVTGRAPAIKLWLTTATTSLGNHSDRLNAINIFPVPDGDTGTNLYSTVAAAAAALQDENHDDLGAYLSVAATAAMENARGNSGTLVAVILAALAESLEGVDRLTAQTLALALDRATVKAWAALSEPVAGTMLSVLDSTATTVRSVAAGLDESGQSLKIALEDMVSAAVEAVRETESQLQALQAAHVVDSGGVGLLLLLDALRAAVLGEELDPDLLAGLSGYNVDHPHIHQVGDPVEGYEVMCSIDLSALDAATLRYELDRAGDSVIMSAVKTLDEEAQLYRWRVHVHVADKELALAAIDKVGTAENLIISDLCTHESA